MTENKVDLWGQFSTKEAQEFKDLLMLQAQYPVIVNTQAIDILNLLRDIPGILPKVFEYLDVLQRNATTMHGNSRMLWTLFCQAEFIPQKRKAN